MAKDRRASTERSDEARYRRIIDDQTEFIVRWRPDGVRTFVNDSYCRYYGIDPADAVGTSFFPLVSAADLAEVERRIASLTPESPVSTGEHRVVRPDGSVGWNRWTDRAFFDGEGVAVEYQSVGQDVTERVQALHALRESQARLSLIYNSTNEYMALLGVVAAGSYVVESCNRAVLSVLQGMGAIGPAEDLVGLDLAHFLLDVLRVDQAKLDFVLGKFAEAERLGTTLQYDAETRARGVTILAETTLTPIQEEDGRCTHLLWVSRDISDRKRAEDALRRALEEVKQLTARLQDENVYLQDEIKVQHGFADIVGTSDALRRVLRQVEQVAPTDATVLVLGETGTGKELVARGVHELSGRKNRPLVKVNCAALPANLIESELFGHERGAFTGALARRIGRFELADQGTIFLDEIGDLPLELQAKLLRVLQEGEFQRLGGQETLHADVRVIAATNRELERLVHERVFREDLYFRLNVFPIHLPALRERKEDIPLIARHFIARASAKLGKPIDSVPAKLIAELQAYHWPGNIRELENIIERAMVISRGSKLELGPWLTRDARRGGSPGQSVTMREMERQHIVETLQKCGWRVSGARGAAEVLDLKPTTLEARMKKLGIERPR